MDLVRDVLDNRLVSISDKDQKCPIGRVDGLLLELRDNEPPRIVAIESGLPVLGRRIHPILERWIRAIGRRFGVRRGRVYRIPWSRVASIGLDIKLKVDAPHSPGTAWERWLHRHVLSHLPGGHR